MNIPSPYFQGVPGAGDLEMDEIIVDYDYPLLSVLKSKSGELYLCMCYDVSDAQRWIVTPVSCEQLKDLLQNNITLDAPFTEPSTKKILAEWNVSKKTDTYQQISAEEIPERCLPIAGEYLEAEPDEWRDYIAELDKRQRTHDVDKWSNYILELAKIQSTHDVDKWSDYIAELPKRQSTYHFHDIYQSPQENICTILFETANYPVVNSNYAFQIQKLEYAQSSDVPELIFSRARSSRKYSYHPVWAWTGVV